MHACLGGLAIRSLDRSISFDFVRFGSHLICVVVLYEFVLPATNERFWEGQVKGRLGGDWTWHDDAEYEYDMGKHVRVL